MIHTTNVNTLRLIKRRRSVRRFMKKKIPHRIVRSILAAGQWAPSGLNNQPWRFRVVRGQEKDQLAPFTKYSYIMKGADAAILVFLDKQHSYHRGKDLMAVGACIQNMLLYLHAVGLGACWLGEILNKKENIRRFLKLPRTLELTAVIALGTPAYVKKEITRKKLKDLMV